MTSTFHKHAGQETASQEINMEAIFTRGYMQVITLPLSTGDGQFRQSLSGWVETAEDDDHTETSQRREETLGRFILELGTANASKLQGIMGRWRWSRTKWTLGLLTFMVGTPQKKRKTAWRHSELKKQEVRSCFEQRFYKISPVTSKSADILQQCSSRTATQSTVSDSRAVQPSWLQSESEHRKLTETHSEVTYRRLCR